MKKEKKNNMNERQKNIAILLRNKQLLKFNVLILGAGLALSYVGRESIGEPLIWLGIIIFGYTTITGFSARKHLKEK